MSRRRYDPPVIHIHVNDPSQVVVTDDAEVYIQHGPETSEEVDHDHDLVDDFDDDDEYGEEDD